MEQRKDVRQELPEEKREDVRQELPEEERKNVRHELREEERVAVRKQETISKFNSGQFLVFWIAKNAKVSSKNSSKGKKVLQTIKVIPLSLPWNIVTLIFLGNKSLCLLIPK